MGTDPDVCRYGMRWRANDLSIRASDKQSSRTVCRNPFRPQVSWCNTEDPSKPDQRKWDFGGASAAVSAEEGSGLAALQLAQRAIAKGELDAASVGAVDFSIIGFIKAVQSIKEPAPRAPDAAVVWVLQATETQRRTQFDWTTVSSSAGKPICTLA